MKSFNLYMCVLGLALLLAGPAPAKEKVDLLLVLAVDVSASIRDPEVDGVYEYFTQKSGIVEALRDPEVEKAFKKCPKGVGLTYVEWSGKEGAVEAKQVVPWTKISDKESLEKFAGAVYWANRSFQGDTDIEGALRFSASLFEKSPFPGDSWVINLSSDGTQNVFHPQNRPDLFSGGRRALDSLRIARDRIVAKGISINALVITNDGFFNGTPEQKESTLRYFQDNVIGGPSSFASPVQNFQDYSRQMKEQLKQLGCVLTS